MMRASTGAQTMNTSARRAFIMTESPMPMTSISGLRTRGRSPPLMAFWMTVTSVVMRVTRPEVSKWSRFEKAKLCTRRNSASRMFAPQP